MAAPVYKLTGGQERKYLADADRPAEVDRLKTIVTESCSAEPEIRRIEESEAARLHRARSLACMGDREKLLIMEKPESRTPEDDLARYRKRVAEQCPDAGLSDVWLVYWVHCTRFRYIPEPQISLGAIPQAVQETLGLRLRQDSDLGQIYILAGSFVN